MAILPMVGDELAGYRLRGVLGRGGMSVVYEAENPRLGSTVALKVLAPELATNDLFRARFLRESRIAASLNHPNVIPIYDMGAHEDLLFIAMRYVVGAPGYRSEQSYRGTESQACADARSGTFADWPGGPGAGCRAPEWPGAPRRQTGKHSDRARLR